MSPVLLFPALLAGALFRLLAFRLRLLTRRGACLGGRLGASIIGLGRAAWQSRLAEPPGRAAWQSRRCSSSPVRGLSAMDESQARP